MHDDKTIAVLKALADPTRLQMVRQLVASPTGQRSCGELSSKADLSQPAMSHHFAKLVNSRVILEHKEGVHKIYELNRPLLEKSGIVPEKL